MPDQSNRVQVLYISDDYVLQAIAGMYGRQPQVLHMLKLPIPDGARVLRCHADWSRRAVGFLVEHESFPEVPAGVAPPDMLIDDGCDAEIVSIPWAEDGKLPPSYEALQARVKELESAIGSMVPTIIRCFIEQNRAAGNDDDAESACRVLARVNAAMNCPEITTASPA